MYTSSNTSNNVVSRIYNSINLPPNTIVLDYGGGKYDTAINYMKEKNVDVLIYDPYNRSERYNETTIKFFKAQPAHFVVCSNVFCTIKEDEVILEILENIKSLMANDGILYICTYERDRSGIGCVSKPDCWQRNALTKSYIPLIKQVFPNCSIKNKIITAQM